MIRAAVLALAFSAPTYKSPPYRAPAPQPSLHPLVIPMIVVLAANRSKAEAASQPASQASRGGCQ